MTDLQSSKMVKTMKIKEITEELSPIEEAGARCQVEQHVVLVWILCDEGHCWNDGQNLNSVSGHRVFRCSMPYSCNFSVIVKHVTFFPWITIIYASSPFLIHQLFDFRIYSWAQSVICPQCLEHSKPS